MKKFFFAVAALLIGFSASAQQALWGGASVESPVVNEDGTVNIAAVTHNNYIQYSTGYSSAGAYTSPQDGGLLPYLYKVHFLFFPYILSI